MTEDETKKVKFNIRPMREIDIRRVAELDALCFTLPWPENSFRYDLLSNRHSRMWVAEAEIDSGFLVVASLVVWIILDEAHIGTIAVDPNYRSQGIGNLLMRTLITRLQTEQVCKVFLEVRKSNLIAQGLYRKFGFENARVRPGYYSDNHEDAIEMELMLERE